MFELRVQLDISDFISGTTHAGQNTSDRGKQLTAMLKDGDALYAAYGPDYQ